MHQSPKSNIDQSGITHEQGWRKKTIAELKEILEEKSQLLDLLVWQFSAMRKITTAEICQMPESRYHQHVANELDCLTKIESLWNDIPKIRTIIRKRVAINNQFNELSSRAASPAPRPAV